MSPVWRSTGLWIAASILGVLLLGVAALALLDWNRFKPRIERVASVHLGRTVSLGGPLKVRLLSRNPMVTINDLSVGGPPWDPERHVAEIERLTLELDLRALLTVHVVLRRVEVRHPKLYLHVEKSGRANWTFENKAPTNERAPPPVKLPGMRELVVEDGLSDDLSDQE